MSTELALRTIRETSPPPSGPEVASTDAPDEDHHDTCLHVINRMPAHLPEQSLDDLPLCPKCRHDQITEVELETVCIPSSLYLFNAKEEQAYDRHRRALDEMSHQQQNFDVIAKRYNELRVALEEAQAIEKKEKSFILKLEISQNEVADEVIDLHTGKNILSPTS